MLRRHRRHLLLATVILIIGFVWWWRAFAPVAKPSPTIDQEQATAETSTEQKPLSTARDLAEALQAAGARVTVGRDLTQPFFSVPGTLLTLGTAGVQVFTFPTKNDAQAAVQTIARDGSAVGAEPTTWVAAPHFFTRDSIVALYLGDDPTVRWFLTNALGPQVAGR